MSDASEFDLTLPDGRTITGQRAGDPAGPVVIYHHGTPGSRVLAPAWISDAEARGLALVGFDRPGYGGSSRQPGRSVADVVADTAALADHLGVERFVTWGLSGGGPHALACAALLPDRVTAAASVSGVAPYDADGLDFLDGMGQDNLDEFAAAVAGEADVRAYLDAARPGLLASAPNELAAELAGLLPPADVALLEHGAAQFLHASMITGLGPQVDGWVDDDLAFVHPWGFALGSMRTPTLIVQGDQDLMVPFAHGTWLAGAVTGATAQFRPGEGHLSSLADISAVHEWLLAPTSSAGA